MKKFLALIILPFIFSSCMVSPKNQNMIKGGINSKKVDRIIITNNKYGGRYSIIDKKTIERFVNIILESKDVNKPTDLESDFTIDFYGETKNIASFKYIAGIEDTSQANLTDINGRLYHVDTSIENEFIGRLMKKNSYKNVRAYYESLIERIFEKINAKKGDVVVIDISKDYIVTKSITSLEQKKMIDSIDSSGVIIKYPSENCDYDYYIKIDTKKYNDTSCSAYVTVTDKLKAKVVYIIEGSFKDGWSYYIRYK